MSLELGDLVGIGSRLDLDSKAVSVEPFLAAPVKERDTWKETGAHADLVQAFRKHWRAGEEKTLVASMVARLELDAEEKPSYWSFNKEEQRQHPALNECTRGSEAIGDRRKRREVKWRRLSRVDRCLVLVVVVELGKGTGFYLATQRKYKQAEAASAASYMTLAGAGRSFSKKQCNQPIHFWP